MTTVILIGDTHMPRFGQHLPGALVDGLRGANLILHAGDITDAFVLDLFRDYAPVEAVAGNNDPPDLAAELGFTRTVEIDGLRLGLTHGHLPPGRTTPERARRAFAAAGRPLDAICFGHSHIPLIEHDGRTWLLNPGSPTDKRRQPQFTYMRIEIEHGAIRPELVAYSSRGAPPAACPPAGS